jgi:hypothetical protein
MDVAVMSQNSGALVVHETLHETVGSLKPALASIKASCEYMGGVSRAKFYADILPLLETVKLGSRNFVVVASMDRLIEANRSKAA